MIFAPTPDGEKNPPSFLCEDCDRLDPLTSRLASGWLQSELKPPKWCGARCKSFLVSSDHRIFKRNVFRIIFREPFFRGLFADSLAKTLKWSTSPTCLLVSTWPGSIARLMVSPARSTGNQPRHLPAVEDDDRPTIDKPPKGELWSDPLIASDFANLVEYPPLLPHAVQV
jgi:hypothetical protein